MDWCVDTRVPGAASATETEIATHLARHAIDPALVELARPLVRQVLARHPSDSLWISLSWEAPIARLQLRVLGDEPLPGRPLGPGLTASHREAPSLWARHGQGEALAIELGVARAPEGNLDPGPADPELLPSGNPAALVGVIAGGQASGASVEERAAGAGATLAARHLSGSSPPGDAVALAEAIIATEAEIGGDFRLVTSSDSRAVIANHRCPFGPSPPPGLCRFTSALAGTMAATVAGSAEVALDERLALGDAQCRLVVDLGSNSDRLTSHHYTWPPAGLPEVE
ncbi:MAG TPA: methanogen output domain 1-containing protein, partial [Acidimicrobiales bacterium]|nr:methanogen output domain 1-containing protein [Acidimicrobiales bacterium]